MSKTPRTDANLQQTGSAGGSNTTAVYVFASFARTLELELNSAKNLLQQYEASVRDWTTAATASQEREVVLREACQEAFDVYFDPGENEPKPNTLGWDAVEKLRKALTQPAPPCIPLEDVTPLVDVLRVIAYDENEFGDDSDRADQALKPFLAKHPIP